MLQFLSGELWLLAEEGEDFLAETVLKKTVNFNKINRIKMGARGRIVG
jgi:hypothetical protein